MKPFRGGNEAHLVAGDPGLRGFIRGFRRMSDTATGNILPKIQGPFVTAEGLFSSDDLNVIERYGDALPLKQAALTGNKASYDGNIRRTRVAWLEPNAQTNAFYRRMEEIVLGLNRQFFGFNLSGLAPMQYAVYDASERSHFDWHIDYGRERGHEQHEPRKLSLSLQLSGPSQYQGGELQGQIRSTIEVAPKTRGALIAFPSYLLHRVTPVTRGSRKSLVVWAQGPEYR
jgi:PKHD-type hydroxylase